MSDDGGCLGVIILVVIVVLIVRSCDFDQRIENMEKERSVAEKQE